MDTSEIRGAGVESTLNWGGDRMPIEYMDPGTAYLNGSQLEHRRPRTSILL